MRRRALISLLGSATVIWPLVSRAQRLQPVPVIGFLSVEASGPAQSIENALLQGLGEAGYIEGRSVVVERRWAEGQYDRLPALASELVDRKVDVIVTGGGPPVARAAKNATSTIPIVFVVGSDPVEEGLVSSLARPGGNVTGVSILVVDLLPKRLDLLSELVPEAKTVTLLMNPNSPNRASNHRVLQEMDQVARSKGLRLDILQASTEREVDSAFTSLARSRAIALVVHTDAFFNSRRDQLVRLAAQHAIPAIYTWREFATAGGLVSYGPSRASLYRLAGVNAGRILKGSKPADLPVVQPTVFELVVNLKTAKALGLTVPPSILARADEVIE